MGNAVSTEMADVALLIECVAPGTCSLHPYRRPFLAASAAAFS